MVASGEPVNFDRAASANVSLDQEHRVDDSLEWWSLERPA
jgi:hypothetical protein